MDNLIAEANAALKGGTVKRMSALLHESERGTQQAFEEAVPVSIAGLADQAETEDGARSLLETFRAGEYPHVDPEDLGRAVVNPDDAARVVASGEGWLSRTFGTRLGGIVDGVAHSSGVSRASASKLLALAAPVVMGAVGKRALARRLDPRGLGGFLAEQRGLAGRALPTGMLGLLGMTPAIAGAAGWGARRIMEVPHREVAGRRSILPWLLAGLAALLGAWWLVGQRSQRTAREIPAPAATRPIEAQPQPAVPLPQAPVEAPPVAAPPVEAPPVAALSEITGYAPLSTALAGSTELPQRFVLDDLRFETDSARLDAGGLRVLDQVAAALASHPAAMIRVEGHTDATGAQAANRALSIERAQAVKSYLVEKGVAADHIETAGLSSTQPIASDDTPEGNRQNRRTELVLTGR